MGQACRFGQAIDASPGNLASAPRSPRAPARDQDQSARGAGAGSSWDGTGPPAPGAAPSPPPAPAATRADT
eukprot:2052941-Pyramimonas_sp.AAC.1